MIHISPEESLMKSLSKLGELVGEAADRSVKRREKIEEAVVLLSGTQDTHAILEKNCSCNVCRATQILEEILQEGESK